jgi:hypothetical protein
MKYFWLWFSAAFLVYDVSMLASAVVTRDTHSAVVFSILALIQLMCGAYWSWRVLEDN